MRRPVLNLFRRLKLVFQLMLVLAAFAPAISAHACVDADCDAVAISTEATTDDTESGCADCGPACANGCCHAPHPATTPDLHQPQPPTAPALQLSWSHSTAQPLIAPSGPRRPPRD